MKDYNKMTNFLFKAIFCLFLSVNLSAQPFDLKFIDFEMQDTVLLHEDFLIEGKITNVGNLSVPPGILMNFLISGNVPASVPQNGIPTYAFNSNSPLLPPGDTIFYSKDIEADNDYFLSNYNNIVTIWPRSSAGSDSDSTNNIVIDSIYVIENPSNIFNSNFNSNKEIKLFPNPATDVISLTRGKNWGRNISVIIYNIQGKVMMISEFIGTSNDLTLRIKQLPPGSFSLVAYDSSNAKRLVSKQFVKQ